MIPEKATVVRDMNPRNSRGHVLAHSIRRASGIGAIIFDGQANCAKHRQNNAVHRSADRIVNPQHSGLHAQGGAMIWRFQGGLLAPLCAQVFESSRWVT